jgi:SAM-dependent methyltransferase
MFARTTGEEEYDRLSTNVTEGQTLSGKQAEVARPFYGTEIIEDEHVAALHKERAETTLRQLTELAERGVQFTPFLEIGAGAGMRSVALANHFGADGVATEISQNSLANAPFTLSLLGYKDMPLLIACDAQHLPFLSHTFRFVFCFQTLHHFDDPDRAVAECYRVLGRGGHFYFAEEPIGGPMRRLLRGNRVRSEPLTPIQRLGARLGVEEIFWRGGALEESLGITESYFDIGVWRHALRRFSKVSAVANRRLRIKTDLRRRTPGYLLASLTGGQVKGLCVKSEGQEASGSPRDRLVCLDCGTAGPSVRETEVLCAACGRSYPIESGILRMFPRELETKLYS